MQNVANLNRRHGNEMTNLTHYLLVSTRACIHKQTCTIQLQICLGMYDFIVDTRRSIVKHINLVNQVVL